MANIVITNNGNSVELPELLDEEGNVIRPAQDIDPSIVVTDENGNFRTLKPGECSGFALGALTIEVSE